MDKGLLPGNGGNRGVGPLRTKTPGKNSNPTVRSTYPTTDINRSRIEGPRRHNCQSKANQNAKPRQSLPISVRVTTLIRSRYTWNQKAVATARASDRDKWDTAPTEPIRYSGLGHIWVGKRPLAVGAFDMAGLWEELDDGGNVVEVNRTPSM